MTDETELVPQEWLARLYDADRDIDIISVLEEKYVSRERIERSIRELEQDLEDISPSEMQYCTHKLIEYIKKSGIVEALKELREQTMKDKVCEEER